jgi:enoyl-CoA hydratase/carnithine racemase
MTLPDRTYQTLLVEARGPVAWVTLNRPERRNAIGTAMVNELLYVLEDVDQDDTLRCTVLTGAGRAFCAGGDFSQMTSGSSDEALPPKGDYQALLLAMWRTEKPIVARVNGHAMGGGLGLVAASTFAVASREAKLGTPEVNVGLFPFMILAVLERLMGRRRLVKMLTLGERLTADEAALAGLVNDAVDDGALDDAVAALTGAICDKSPMTLRLGLRAMADVDAMTLEEKLPVLGQRLVECLGTEDAREGLAAFLQKRRPDWKGR